MAIFPKCTFQVLVPNGHIVAGQRLDAVLVVTAPQPIPRAEGIDLLFQSLAWASYGKSAVNKVMFQAPLELELDKRVPFAAGEHRYPFAVDIPAWLPPELNAGTFGIRHTIDARLEVDWAVDPTAAYIWPRVDMPPRSATRRPLTIRSQPGFYKDVVVEVTLSSATVAIGEPIHGQIALRSGHAVAFDYIDLALCSNATLAIGIRDRLTTPMSRVRIPAPALRAGGTLSFTFPSAPHLPPSYKTSFIDHDVSIAVSIPNPWSANSRFEVPIEILPAGSIVQGSLSTSLLGGDRVRRIATAMADDTGLIAGTQAPVLVHGSVGALKVSMIDAPRKGKLGIDVDITFPDLELGIVLRTRGLIEDIVGTPTSPFLLIAPPLYGWHLSLEPSDARPKLTDASLAPFFGAALRGPREEIRLSDHHLGFHVSLIDDEPQRLIDVAREVCAQAKRVGDAIRALPFPESLAESRPAWQATADEQNAFLVPSTPTIHGIVLRAQILGGEERTIAVNFRTIWRSETPLLQAVIDLRNAPLPEASRRELESESEKISQATRRRPENALLTSVRAIFPEAHATGNGEAVALNDAKWPPDPRTLLPTLDTFFGWILEARGERRVDAPYR
jgi:Arrestin (or S-antigen), N-terminal domain